jgi:hypothetical protein
MEVKKLKQALAAVVINVSEEDGSVSAAVRMTVEDELLSETPQVTRIVDNLDDVPLQEMFEELLDKFNMLAVEDQSKKKPRKRKPAADKSAKPKLFEDNEDNEEKASNKDTEQPANDDEKDIAGADDEEEEPAEEPVEEEDTASEDDQDEVASDNEDDEDDENVEVEEEDASETAEDEEDTSETDEEEKQDQATRQISLDDMF